MSADGATAPAARAISPADARARLLGRELAIPASTANLGPGFDTLAVALQLYLRVRVTGVADGPGERRFRFAGAPLDGDNAIERAFRRLADDERTETPALAIDVESEIPVRGGLGSSAAATVAGLRLFEQLAGPHPGRDLLRLATELDLHADNVSAALFGGLTASCVCDDGRVIARVLPWPAAIRFVVAMPEVQVATPASRRVLPDTYSRDDAVFNLQRGILLVTALAHGDFAAVREAVRDRWHQPYRASIVPGLEPALALRHPDLLGVCLSGSGPAIVALATGSFGEIERLLQGVFARIEMPCRVCTLAAHQPGALS